MDGAVVQDDYDLTLTGDLLEQILEKKHEQEAVDAAQPFLREEVALRGDAPDDADVLALAGSCNGGGLASWCPGVA